MTEIKKTLSILKARWPEVTLIIGLGFLASLFGGISRVHRGYCSWVVFTCIGLLLIEVLLYLGFLRTVYLESDKRQSPLSLLQKGKHFFWRLCGLGLLYMIVLGLLIQVIFWIMKIVTPIDGSLKEVAPMVGRLCLSIAMLILIKLYLLIPALIIVLDCRAFESFRFLRRCKLLDVKGLLAVYCIQMATPFLWCFLPASKEVATVAQSILGLSYYVIWNLLTLMILVMAVRFVASLGLLYDRPQNALNSEGPLRNTIED